MSWGPQFASRVESLVHTEESITTAKIGVLIITCTGCNVAEDSTVPTTFSLRLLPLASKFASLAETGNGLQPARIESQKQLAFIILAVCCVLMGEIKLIYYEL